MKKTLFLLAALALLAACSSQDKMTKQAENIKIECIPPVLEVINGTIDATVSVTYPDGYYNPGVVMEVTPVIVYEGGEASMKPFKYQGENVRANYKVISSKGQKVTENIHFDYVEGMEKCFLELRGKVLAKGKQIPLPTKKVADGANTTYMLVKPAANVAFKDGEYQEMVPVTVEGQIKYDVNSSEVRNSELKSASVKEFQQALKDALADERATVKNAEIVAYASPEGSAEHNEKLSEDRSGSAGKAWASVTKGITTDKPEVRSVGEDWEGFQKLVAESDLEDKDLILRVLSMYSDPAVRESEIKNMSQVYTALKGEVLPELRRARLIANIEYRNYTSDELLEVLKENEDILDEEALLRAATVAKETSQKEHIWKKAVSKFDSERAHYNLAAMYAAQGKDKNAEEELAKYKVPDSDYLNIKGLIAMHKEDYKNAEELFRRSNTESSKLNLGVLLINTGQYEEASRLLANAPGCCHNTVLSLILTDQLEKAMATAHCGDPKVWYLKAIIAARQGNGDDVKKYLEKAFKNPSLKERAARDVEFAGYEF
jgi:outer membrane protein OmpA-like peptidoglycan-associated protein